VTVKVVVLKSRRRKDCSVKWLKSFKDIPSKSDVRLICMRLADMKVTHPEQVTDLCFKCGHEVGIYPSGQRALKRHPRTQIVCVRCAKPKEFDLGMPAAETREEYEAEHAASKPVSEP
jgi:hypothetical protein